MTPVFGWWFGFKITTPNELQVRMQWEASFSHLPLPLSHTLVAICFLPSRRWKGRNIIEQDSSYLAGVFAVSGSGQRAELTLSFLGRLFRTLVGSCLPLGSFPCWSDPSTLEFLAYFLLGLQHLAFCYLSLPLQSLHPHTWRILCQLLVQKTWPWGPSANTWVHLPVPINMPTVYATEIESMFLLGPLPPQGWSPTMAYSSST